MKSLWIVLVVICFATSIGYWLWRTRAESRLNQFGFRDWVKNPQYRSEAEEYFAEREALTVRDDIPAEEIQAMVDHLFEQDDDDFNLDKIKLVGTKATEQLVAALKTERAYSLKFPEGGHALDAGSPFERICDLLEETCPVEAAQPLARYADHPDNHFRKYAAITLGNIATIECIEPLQKLLDDDDDYVRSFALMGIERGLTAGRGSKQFFSALFPAIEALLNPHGRSVSGEAPSLLLAIDRDRALPLLLSEKHLVPDNGQLHYILRALNEEQVPVPHEHLLPLLATLEQLVENYPHGYQFSAALIAYAQHPDAQTRSFLEQRAHLTNKEVAEAATEGLGILSGLHDPTDFVLGLVDEHDWEDLTTQQQHYFAVFIYNAEVNNGGHSQYFVNSAGDLYQAALEGLKVIGAKHRAEILTEAVQIFGAGGPSVDNWKRHEQLAALSSGQDAQLSALDSRYYKCPESVNALLNLYAIKHKEHFSPD